MQKETKTGHLPTIIQALGQKFNFDPKYATAWLLVNFPHLEDKTKCGNCEASMEVSIYSPDVLDAVLLMRMANVVQQRLHKGMTFTEANEVHVPTLDTTDAIRHRTTRCSYLNYIKQPKGLRQTGRWVITSWGWKALRGEPVPKAVKYFRGHLIERGEDTITLSEMFRVHTDMVQAALLRNKSPRSDLRELFAGYNPNDWREFGGYAEGSLL